jgi:hypothetical protein
LIIIIQCVPAGTVLPSQAWTTAAPVISVAGTLLFSWVSSSGKTVFIAPAPNANPTAWAVSVNPVATMLLSRVLVNSAELLAFQASFITG